MASVFITGANRGIGLELARQYASDGWRVHAASRKPDTAEQIVGDVVGHMLDVTDVDQLAALGGCFVDETLDLVINNAGVWFADVENLEGFQTTAWERYLRVNALGPLLVSQALANSFAKNGAKLVNISARSSSITLARDKGFGYGPSKAALNAITKSLSVDLAPRQIIVIAITPGWVNTDMGADGANIEVEESVRGIRDVIARTTMESTGRFFEYDGVELPW